MASEKTFTLSNQSKITAKELAVILGITPAAARYRLNKSVNVEYVFLTTGDLLKGSPKIWILSDGTSGTIREFSDQTGLKENTLRQRLKLSNDRDYVLRSETFEKLNANIYILDNGDEYTAQDFSKKMNISSSQAHDILKDISVDIRQHRMVYELNDGQKVTLAEIIEKTGLSKSAATKRINKSRIASKVLKPHRLKSKQIKNIKKAEFISKLHADSVGLNYHLESCPVTGKLVKKPIN